MVAPLAELRDSDAPSDIVALYARIRQASCVPQVNLIFRHLATLPGVLAWMWRLLEELYASTQLEDAAGRLRAELPADDLEALWARLPSEVGVEVEHVLAFYERANARNAIALTALMLRYQKLDRSHRGAVGPDSVSAVQQQSHRPIVALPRLADLDEDLQRRVRALAKLHREERVGVIPSLYLHLAVWPPLLQRASDRLGGYVGSAAWRRRRAALRSAIQSEAGRLTTSLPEAAPLPNAEALAQGVSAIELFLQGTIPDMLLVGARLTGRRSPSRAMLR